MPGGLHAYIPAVKVCFFPRSMSSPSRIQTSSQKSCAIVSVVSTPASNWSRRGRAPAPEHPALFPQVGGVRLGGLDAGVELEQAGQVAVLAPAQDLLPDAGASRSARSRARDGLPGNMVGLEELELRVG